MNLPTGVNFPTEELLQEFLIFMGCVHAREGISNTLNYVML